ncbi:MAG: hypothetical protein GF393_12805 [Armatimonadia bacterium]|nr:hypothetical protein [Armatimonadia bacterium]
MTVHHWNSLSEAQKLTQSQLIPGVIEEDIRRNPILMQPMPVAWTPGQTIKYNRENANMTGEVAGIDIGDQLSWTNSVTYTQKEVTLKRRYVQRIIDNFIPDVYGTINDYEAIVLQECKKGVFVDLNDQIFYGDLTYSSGNKEFDGLHAWAAEQALSATGGLNTDGESEGFNFDKMRRMVDSMKAGIDVVMMPFAIGRRLSAAAYETGLEVNGVLTTRAQMSYLTFGVNDLGKRVMFWDGVPIVLTDYLVAEEDGTGTGSSGDARAKYSSDSTYSFFGIKFGNVFMNEPGVMFGYGATDMSGDLYRLNYFDALEDYDASGMRVVSYGAVLLGSKYGLCRYFDCDDSAAKAAG